MDGELGRILIAADRFNATLFRSAGLTVVEAENQDEVVREVILAARKYRDIALIIVLKHLVDEEDKLRKSLEDIGKPILILPTRWAKAEPINVEKLLAKALGFG